MRGVSNPELKAECIRLRVQKRLSLREIHQVTGAPKGSLSGWLKPHPLTEVERKARQKVPKVPKKDRGAESALHKMSPNPLGNAHKARVAEAAVLLRLVVFGMRVFGPVFDGDKADWLVITPSRKTFKVQVKSVKVVSRGGLPLVAIRCAAGRSGSRRYTEGELDFLVGYDFFTDTAYVWSWEDLRGHKATITVCPEAAERWDKLFTGG